MRQYWDESAGYYDSFYADRHDDVRFWSALAERTAGPVLEIGCGTGRVALEIARAGKDVFGVDQSDAMLNVFRRKLSAEPDVERRVSLTKGDMRTFQLGRTFPLVLIPFRPLQHMLTLEDQIAAFENARRHLEPDGLLGFDVFFPIPAVLDQPIGVERPEREWTDANRHTVKRFYVRERWDKLNQVMHGSFIFRTYAGDQQIGEERSSLEMSYYTYPELRLILKLTGFEIVEQYGSFARDPITVEREIIIVARAA
jgi:SAM-dependent methyltransferase